MRDLSLKGRALVGVWLVRDLSLKGRALVGVWLDAGLKSQGKGFSWGVVRYGT